MTVYTQLDDLLMIETSRRTTDSVAELVFQKPELFNDLFSIFLSNREPVSRRAAWVIDTVSEAIPSLIEPRINEIIGALGSFRHDGLKRHSLRIISRSPLPGTELLGMLTAICFDWLLSAGESVAVKVHSMDILYRIAIEEPDLRKELADSIGWRMEEGTAGFRNHASKILQKLSRLE